MSNSNSKMAIFLRWTIYAWVLSWLAFSASGISDDESLDSTWLNHQAVPDFFDYAGISTLLESVITDPGIRDSIRQSILADTPEDIEHASRMIQLSTKNIGFGLRPHAAELLNSVRSIGETMDRYIDTYYSPVELEMQDSEITSVSLESNSMDSFGNFDTWINPSHIVGSRRLTMVEQLKSLIMYTATLLDNTKSESESSLDSGSTSHFSQTDVLFNVLNQPEVSSLLDDGIFANYPRFAMEFKDTFVVGDFDRACTLLDTVLEIEHLSSSSTEDICIPLRQVASSTLPDQAEVSEFLKDAGIRFSEYYDAYMNMDDYSALAHVTDTASVDSTDSEMNDLASDNQFRSLVFAFFKEDFESAEKFVRCLVTLDFHGAYAVWNSFSKLHFESNLDISYPAFYAYFVNSVADRLQNNADF